MFTLKSYADLYKYCDAIIENALAIEELPGGFTKEQIKARKFRNMQPYPPNMISNPNAFDADGAPIPGEPAEIEDPSAKYDMNEIFALINYTTSNLRELAEDIGTFSDRIANAEDKQKRGFNVGNLIMNLQGQQQKLTIEFGSYITRLKDFLSRIRIFQVDV